MTSTLFSQQEQTSGFLKIDSDKKNLTILVNEQSITMPVENVLTLQSGNYTVVVFHPERFLWGNLDFEDRIIIFPADTVTLKPVFQTLLNIRSEPQHAKIYQREELLGETPFSIKKPNNYFSEIVLKKDGYCDHRILLDQVKNNRVMIELNKTDSIFNLHKIKFKNMKSRNRKMSYGFFGLSLISGFSSIYFKSQADENYQKYLTSGSLKNMNNHFRQSKKYDRYTNSSLGVLQGCFLLSFYFLMKSFE